MKDRCRLTTDKTNCYNLLATNKNAYHIKVENRKDSKAEDNLNRINSFHSMMRSQYRFYRGVASKYINRYCALFSYMWKLHKVDNLNIKFEQAFKDLKANSVNITQKELLFHRLYEPAELEWRSA